MKEIFDSAFATVTRGFQTNQRHQQLETARGFQVFRPWTEATALSLA